VFASVNVRVKSAPLFWIPESHGVQSGHGGPGVHPPGVQVPDVVEWKLATHCHVTVSPTWTVSRLGTKFVPP